MEFPYTFKRLILMLCARALISEEAGSGMGLPGSAIGTSWPPYKEKTHYVKEEA